MTNLYCKQHPLPSQVEFVKSSVCNQVNMIICHGMARLHIFNKKQGRETEKSSNYTPYVLVGIAAILCYLNTLFGEFVYDDYEVIETNADVR